MNDLLSAALGFAAHGWRVFPCLEKSKVPATANGFRDATTDSEAIENLWAENPNYNVAIATGEVSGLFVLDVDEKPGRTIDEALAGLPKLPDTPCVRTGGGGLQFFFKYPQGVNLTISAGRLGVGIDTRGNGGYVVAPPSVHDKTGRVYQWIDSDDVALAECPVWVVDKLRAQEKKARLLTESGEKIKAGRHDVLMTAGALMRSVGLIPCEIEAALQKMRLRIDFSDCPDRDIDREIASIARWCADKDVGTANVVSVAHGDSVAQGLLANFGGGAEAFASKNKTENPGTFPPRLLAVPGIVGEWCDWINSTSLKRQPELALAAVLTACGALIGRRLRTKLDGRANVYFLGLCETGGGKERARQGVKEVMLAAGVDHLLGPEEFASDAGIYSALEHEPCQIFLLDEFGKFLEAINSKGAGAHLIKIPEALLKLYSSANSVVKGKAYADAKKNTALNQPHACFYATAVPEQTWAAMGEKVATDGFLARLMVMQAADNFPKMSRPTMSPPPPSLVGAIRRWHESAPSAFSSVNPVPEVVAYEPAADVIFDEYLESFDLRVRQMGDSPLRALWTRAYQKAHQLSLIYSFSCGTKTITEAGARWACEVSEYLTLATIYHAQRYLAGSRVEGEIKEILRYIGDCADGRSKTELYNKFRKLGKRGLEEALEMLEAGGSISWSTTTTEDGGRPRTVARALS